jgi:hypothetical protein
MRTLGNVLNEQVSWLGGLRAAGLGVPGMEQTDEAQNRLSSYV